ncbi:phosphoglucomutase/phosphomannomutase family protein [Candidatus Sumerlaeota bacterium]|nr:phosphoglucomutase/phosphomannomutase family protein [Candidatus Sumerlaeota bacterium]
MTDIYFGTDGWRGIIGENFTFENVRRAAIALSYLLRERKIEDRPVVIGYDYRFMSEYFARAVYDELVQKKIHAELSDRAIPTPALSFATKKRSASCGVMITASHNPHFYNGIKFKASYGGPVMPEFTFDLTRLLQKVPTASREAPVYAEKILMKDILSPYLRTLKKYVNFGPLKKCGIKLAVDSMFATGGNLFQELLRETNIRIFPIRTMRNPLFDNDLPEPAPPLLDKLADVVKKNKCDLGLATDGDADRIGVVDAKGNFVTLHYIMPILYEYLIESRGMSGDAVRTTSTDELFDHVCRSHGRQCFEVPVGFNNVCQLILERDILVGGEESGGMCFKNHIPERDGVLSGLLILEMMANKKASLEKMISSLAKRFHPVEYIRIDRICERAKMVSNMKGMMNNPPEKIADSPVENIDRKDGVKFQMANKCWMLMRISDTEPKGRIYVGGREKKAVLRALKAGEKMLFH